MKDFEYHKCFKNEKIIHKLYVQYIKPKDEKQDNYFQGKKLSDLFKVGNKYVTEFDGYYSSIKTVQKRIPALVEYTNKEYESLFNIYTKDIILDEYIEENIDDDGVGGDGYTFFDNTGEQLSTAREQWVYTEDKHPMFCWKSSIKKFHYKVGDIVYNTDSSNGYLAPGVVALTPNIYEDLYNVYNLYRENGHNHPLEQFLIPVEDKDNIPITIKIDDGKNLNRLSLGRYLIEEFGGYTESNLAKTELSYGDKYEIENIMIINMKLMSIKSGDLHSVYSYSLIKLDFEKHYYKKHSKKIDMILNVLNSQIKILKLRQ